MNPDDQRDIEMHASTERYIAKLRGTWGLTRKAVLEHLVAFCENDEESGVFAQPLPKPRKRSRRVLESAAP